MSKKGFIRFDAVEKVLKDNDFFGYTAKRDNGRITYTYRNIHYYLVNITVVTTRLNKEDMLSKKIVLGISINGKELEGWNDFIHSMKNVYKFQREELPKYVKKAKDYGNTTKKDKCN